MLEGRRLRAVPLEKPTEKGTATQSEHTEQVEPPAKGEQQTTHTTETVDNYPRALDWVVTIMCMSLPVIGVLYLLILSFSHASPYKKSFARAYLLVKFIFFVVALTALAIGVYYGIDLADSLLEYMQQL